MDDKTVDKAEAIARLVDLHAEGKITDEELETLRAEAAKPASNNSVALKLAVGLLALVSAIGLFVLLTNSEDSAEEESAPTTTVTEQPSTAPTSTLADEELVVVPTTETAAEPTVPATEAVIKLPDWSDSNQFGTFDEQRSFEVSNILRGDRAARWRRYQNEFEISFAVVKCVTQKQDAATNIEDVLMRRFYIEPRGDGTFRLGQRTNPYSEIQLRLMDEVYAPAKVRTLIRECS